MTATRKVIDFGFAPDHSPLHFALTASKSDVSVEIRFHWGEESEEPAQPEPKAWLDGYRWSRIAEIVAHDFNRRLRAAGQRQARWKAKETLLAPHFGRELVLLIWAVEDADPTLIQNMCANWGGLAPEERWWLFTTVNASSRHPEYGKDSGWRKAIKIAFAENPTFDAALGGLDTLVFSAGIGERSAPIRARICEGLDFLGIELHSARNAAHAAVISADSSGATVRVMRTDEELMIARSVSRLLALETHATERDV